MPDLTPTFTTPPPSRHDVECPECGALVPTYRPGGRLPGPHNQQRIRRGPGGPETYDSGQPCEGGHTPTDRSPRPYRGNTMPARRRATISRRNGDR